MKYVLFLAFSLFFSFSRALTLKEVILTEDNFGTPTYYDFPCSKYIDIITCGSNLILEKGCKKTLKIEKQSLSCKSTRGDIVTFAKILPDSLFVDRTAGGMNGYSLQFSDRVSLVSFQTPNGNTEYQIVVK